MKINKLKASTVVKDLNSDLQVVTSLRQGDEPQDIAFPEFVQEKYNMSWDTYLNDVGVELNNDTISNIVNSPEYKDVRWLVPEIFREALRAGIRTAPIWNNLIITEQQVRGTNITTPWVNMSDATPKRVDEGETIPLGAVSVGSKSVSIYKIGRGIKLTDEVRRYVNLNVVSIYFQDFGVRMGHAMDVLAIDVLLNGDQANGSESAPVIGVATANTLTYKDLLNIWVRSSRMGRNFGVMIGGEKVAKDLLDLDEFKLRSTGTSEATLDMRTPVPNRASMWVHGNIPEDQILLVDPRAALIKYNATPLLIESERIVSNQTEATYASLTTGFSKAFLDASVILDVDEAFATYGFPSYFDVDSQLNQIIN